MVVFRADPILSKFDPHFLSYFIFCFLKTAGMFCKTGFLHKNWNMLWWSMLERQTSCTLKQCFFGGVSLPSYCFIFLFASLSWETFCWIGKLNTMQIIKNWHRRKLVTSKLMDGLFSACECLPCSSAVGRIFMCVIYFDLTPKANVIIHMVNKDYVLQ